MKLHKSKFATRPIINCSNHPTEKISLLIDKLIRPLIIKTESYLQDSQSLLQDALNRSFHSDTKLYSLDFESLYSNIIHNDAILVITDFMKDKLTLCSDLNITGFKTCLELVLNFNFFKFCGQFFKQNKGIAMGTICGPSIANLYLYVLEKKFLFIHKPIYYKRYIDDIFLAIDRKFDIKTLTDNNNFFRNLNLLVSDEGDEVVFLDLRIRFNSLTNKLDFSTYIKPTNTFSFLLTNSNHPGYIIKNNPFSLFLRIRRINVYDYDYLYFARKQIIQLITRGYKYIQLKKINSLVYKIDRESLIPYKTKKNYISKDNNNIFFKMNFDINYHDIFRLIESSFSDTFKIYDWNLKFLNSTQSNLGSRTINLINDSDFFSFKSSKRCNKHNCVACYHIVEGNHVRLNNLLLPTSSNSSCNSICIVYLINCRKCKDVFYIGQTERPARKRIREHLHNIKKFIPYIGDISEVAYHFNLIGHKLEDFEFYILKSEISDLTIRLQTENFYIHLFKTLNFKVINRKISNLYLYNYIYSSEKDPC